MIFHFGALSGFGPKGSEKKFDIGTNYAQDPRLRRLGVGEAAGVSI
jgi:hypothetical protein